MKFRKRPVVDEPITFEAITFDELVAHGRSQGVPEFNGMPWSFSYKGQPITHENDDCYLIPTPKGTERLNRGDILICQASGALYPCKADVFYATYEADTLTSAKARAAAELRELIERHDKLGAFLNEPGTPDRVSVNTWHLLNDQHRAMTEYRRVLSERLESWED